MKRMACKGIGLVIVLGLLGLTAAAQAPTSVSDSGAPLGDYAKQVRKDTTAKKAKVYDNDNLPTDDKLSIVGPTQTAENSSDAKTDDSASSTPGDQKPGDAKAGTDGKTAAAAPPAKVPTDPAGKQEAVKQWNDKISEQKDQIDLTERELNVLQREYQIRAAAMYGDVGNRLRNSSDWDKQDAQYKQQIADKQKALDDARQKLEDTQEDARKAGVPDSDHQQ
jgi:hypothetical protein